MSVVLETSIGDLVIDLYTEERPNCCKNFLKLCKIKYYNLNLFNNVQKNFMAQTGDPTGTGRDGESIYSFVYGEQAKYYEMEKFPKIKHRKLGAVSMVNNGHDMHGSQFLITLAPELDYLDGKHTVFGEVAKGFDVLEKLNEWICDKEGTPYQDIRIMHTVILDDPFEDFSALSEKNRCLSPEPTDEKLESGRIRIDEDVDALDGLTPEELDEYTKNKEARTRTKLLEIIGDLPEADMKPPENVLFVCKLNQVTTDEDLELIFSRFGQINSCEVIRDSKTGDSLCYAFIEFDKEEDCETAYFKMDNVLIDDRRIHVDFSQSVAKVNWKGKGTGTGYFEDKTSFKKDEPDVRKPKYQVHSKSRKGEGYELVFDENENNRKPKYEEMSRGRDNRNDRYSSNDRNYNKRDREYKRDDSYKKDYIKKEESEKPRDRTNERYRDNDRHYREKSTERHRDKYHEKSSHRDRDRERDRDNERDRDRDRDNKEKKHRKEYERSEDRHHQKHRR